MSRPTLAEKKQYVYYTAQETFELLAGEGIKSSEARDIDMAPLQEHYTTMGIYDYDVIRVVAAIAIVDSIKNMQKSEELPQYLALGRLYE